MNKVVGRDKRRASPGNGRKGRCSAPAGRSGAEKAARDAMPKGPLETVAEVRRLSTRCGPAKTSRKAQGFQRKRKPRLKSASDDESAARATDVSSTGPFGTT